MSQNGLTKLTNTRIQIDLLAQQADGFFSRSPSQHCDDDDDAADAEYGILV